MYSPWNRRLGCGLRTLPTQADPRNLQAHQYLPCGSLSHSFKRNAHSRFIRRCKRHAGVRCELVALLNGELNEWGAGGVGGRDPTTRAPDQLVAAVVAVRISSPALQDPLISWGHNSRCLSGRQKDVEMSAFPFPSCTNTSTRSKKRFIGADTIV